MTHDEYNFLEDLLTKHAECNGSDGCSLWGDLNDWLDESQDHIY